VLNAGEPPVPPTDVPPVARVDVPLAPPTAGPPPALEAGVPPECDATVSPVPPAATVPPVDVRLAPDVAIVPPEDLGGLLAPEQARTWQARSTASPRARLQPTTGDGREKTVRTKSGTRSPNPLSVQPKQTDFANSYRTFFSSMEVPTLPCQLGARTRTGLLRRRRCQEPS